MDRERFGRALGVGVRAAAKTLMSAADAAAAPNPRQAAAPTSAPASRPAATPVATPISQPETRRVALPEARVVKTHAQNLKRSVWSPFARFSSVLLLEVVGVFFAIFALLAAQQVWRFRAGLHQAAGHDAQKLYVYVALFLLFGYFTVTSFIRAKRRGRR